MRSSKLTRLFSTAAVIGALATPALAQEEEGIFIPGASAEITLDYVTQYFFRGYEQSNTDTGGAFQPGASFTIDVVEDVTATIGTWGAVEFDAPAGAVNPSAWYEQDYYASLDTTMGDFSMGLGINTYTYPAVAGSNSVVEIAATVGYDDSDLLGDFAFAPYVTVAVEVNNTNTNNAAGDEASYIELGGAFAVPTEGTAIEAWDWSVPFAIGLSLDDYYNDASGSEEFFGFASVGLVGSIPMSELIGTDEFVGAWDLSIGVQVLFLNSDVALTDNADDTSDNIQLIGSIGLSREW
ncbi:MAG: hypothetical protein AB8C95_07100 [Phycisphaeraceae bacterium]